MSDDPPKDAEVAGRRKQVRRTVFILSLMVLAVFAAWAVGTAVEAWLVASHKGSPRTASPGPATAPGEDAEPFSLDSPLAGAGLTDFAGDPGGILPVPSARRVFGYERRLVGQVERQARYEYVGSRESVASHYQAELTRLGYENLKDSVGPDGRRAMVFGKRGAWATVSLRRDARNAKIVIIAVTAVSPVPAGTQTKR